MAHTAPPPTALFGGTFDPVHLGHRFIAETALGACALGRVIFLPCWKSPHKPGHPTSPGHHRVAMLHAALADAPWAEVSTWELDQEAPSFSWKAVEYFARGGGDLAWILGSDQWNAIETWARPDYLARNLTFIAFPREGIDPVPKPGFRMRPIKAVTPGSATEIRRRVRSGDPIDGLVAPAVKDYILAHRLYRDEH